MKEVQTAGGIVVNPEGKIVLVEQGGNSWSFPKGHVEDGEELLETAMREIFEEAGIQEQDLEYVGEIGSYARYSLDKSGKAEDTSLPPRLRTIFLFKTQVTSVVGDGTEITDARFVTIDEAIALLAHTTDKEFLATVREKIQVQ